MSQGMNYTTAALLITDEIRVLACSYENPSSIDNDKAKLPEDEVIRKWELKLLKTVDKTIKPGDYVVAPTDTRHGMTVVRVEYADVEIDVETNVQVGWTVCKVDTETVKKNKEKEAEWVQQLKQVQRKHQREELAKKVLGTYKVDDLKVLSFSGQHDESTLEIQAPKPKAETTA